MIATSNEYPSLNWSPTSLIRALNYQGNYAIWESSNEKITSRNYSHFKEARYSHLFLNPSKTIFLKNNLLSISSAGLAIQAIQIDNSTKSPLSYIEEVLKLDAPFDNEARFFGGLIGFISYDFVSFLENAKGLNSTEDNYSFYFLLCRTSIIFDNLKKTIAINRIEVPKDHNQNPEIKALDNEICEKISTIIKSPAPAKISQQKKDILFRSHFTEEEFSKMVLQAKEYIEAGDIYQVVLANTFNTKETPDPLLLFDSLKQENPSAFHFALNIGEFSLVGASPETFLESEISEESKDKRIKMRLIAGTYPSCYKENNKDQQALALTSDQKEIAEHLMLLDHERNDIGKVSKIGSVKVVKPFSVESLNNIHHLVSEVQGTLDESFSIFNAIEACFPIATLTGTPKIRAMEIIAELESLPRGVFGGSIIKIDFLKNIESTVAIRFAKISPEGTEIKAGAGIVYDSIPEKEYQECCLKAEKIMECVQLSLK